MDSIISLTPLNPCSSIFHNQTIKPILHIHFNRINSPHFSRKIIPTFNQQPDHFLNRTGVLIGNYYRDDFKVNEDDDDDDVDDDRSLDLFVRFLENIFKKISRKARKDVKSVLPFNISSKLVKFSVNGVLMLTFLWVLKAFLEVVCTLGSVAFISILVIRGAWTGISHLQENRYYRRDGIDDLTWSGTRPA
ncbi:protein-binding activity modulator [Lithospermum erythrorhizon]|uniref:Protein-binding activity modulator n=1 Tax=Lithospermum erythrorhizon TaxID=34254 RepID=A0AAV3NV64_LITER